MWTFNGIIVDSVDDIPSDAIGFIYEVTHQPSGKKYIGKKLLKHKKTLPPLKGKKRKRVSYVESDWKSYYGSSDSVKQLLKESGETAFIRRILRYSTSKKQLSYLETRELFHRDVLEKQDEYFNSNIQGRWFPRDVN